MSLTFSTKAGTLSLLKEKLKTARIVPMAFFSVSEWEKNSRKCIEQIIFDTNAGPWIIRSSCQREDSSLESNAGAFLSLLDVGEENLEPAIQQVIAAYGESSKNDQVLVQPMLQNVVRSGVAFSHDPNVKAPYRIINWNEGDNTESVTGGFGGRTWQCAALSPVPPPPALAGVVALLEELLSLFEDTPIDIEFAVTCENNAEILWLLQARPLVITDCIDTPESQFRRLSIIADKVKSGMRPHPFLIGQSTIYGVMPDWNPAEIIGVRPRPFALSLYRDLVTDSIWAYQRHNYGYRNLRSFPLMPHFWGLPYIDVRLSFNSFIPADLEERLAGRLVDHYVNRLMAEPMLHDKVEFEIVFSCYTLDLPQRLESLADAGFSTEDRVAIADSLRQLTNRIVHPKEGLWRADAAKLDTLNERRETLLNSDADPIERIYWLLEDIKRYGTLPFAGLARAGFIAVQMVRSLVAVGVFSQQDYDSFMNSTSTISGQLTRDRALLDKETFIGRYGHLRPGTYDVLSPRYDETPDLYFDWTHNPPLPDSTEPFSLKLTQLRDVVTLLEKHDLKSDGVKLFDFLQAGIELRELAKFYFTRNLSDLLSYASSFGKKWGFSKEDIAYCDIAAFKELYVGAADPEETLARSIEQGKTRYEETLSIVLPPVIAQSQDIWAFEWPEMEPNYITQKQITAPVAFAQEREKLNGAIVFIPNADPGFDWLFAIPIAGLITAWGGANSHMAIRAGELGLPAVIGAGDILYNRWAQANRLYVDCAGRRVETLI